MAVITQNYDIDLKATGRFPVVRMSQFDTGTRQIVFTVYDGYGLANIDDGMVARVDGTRSDGVEFSQSCTVSTGSKVSFTISQEMTKAAGRHSAELVLFDAQGNPIGTQNFVIDVEPAPMVRDSAASADDRTLYDQFTDSVSKSVADKITQIDDSVSKTVDSKMAGVDSKMAGVDSKMASVDSKMAGVDTQISTKVDDALDARIKTDPLLGVWRNYGVNGTVNLGGNWTGQTVPLMAKSQSDGADTVYGSNTTNAIYIYKPGVYQVMMDGWYESSVANVGRSTALNLYANGDSGTAKRGWIVNSSKGVSPDDKSLAFRAAVTFSVPDAGLPYRLEMHTAGGGNAALKDGTFQQMVITRISSTWTPVVSSGGVSSGVRTVSVGSTTTGEPGTQASVVNSGTANDVVLDFTIPKGDKGDKGAAGVGVTEFGTDSIAIGTTPDTSATVTNTVAVGSGARTANNDSVVVGTTATAGGDYSTVIGSGAVGSSPNSTIIGYQAVSTSKDGTQFGGTAVGRGAAADDWAIAIGVYANAEQHAAMAVGPNAHASTTSSVALGDGASASAPNSVALGSSSTAVEADTVSVGNDTLKRRITNVGAPTVDADAATKAYVDNLIAQLKSANGLK